MSDITTHVHGPSPYECDDEPVALATAHAWGRAFLPNEDHSGDNVRNDWHNDARTDIDPQWRDGWDAGVNNVIHHPRAWWVGYTLLLAFCRNHPGVYRPAFMRGYWRGMCAAHQHNNRPVDWPAEQAAALRAHLETLAF